MSYNCTMVQPFVYTRGSRIGEIVLVTYLNELPADTVVCDGRALSKEEYPELYAAIGDTFSHSKYIKRKLSLWEKIKSVFAEVNDTEINPEYKQGYFNIPDLCGRW